MDNPQKQQRRHGDVKHQCRRRVDKVVVNPAHPLEHNAHKQHGKHRGGNRERLKENSQHVSPLVGEQRVEAL